MPNISITHLLAEDWTELNAPIPCTSFWIQNADPDLGFQIRSRNEDPAPELTISPGFALPVNAESSAGLQPEMVLAEVKGGDLILVIGLGMPSEIAE